MYSYSAHVRYNTFYFLKENNIIGIGISAHTSHILQPMDFSAFSSSKSFSVKIFTDCQTQKKVVDAFELANVFGHSIAAISHYKKSKRIPQNRDM